MIRNWIPRQSYLEAELLQISGYGLTSGSVVSGNIAPNSITNAQMVSGFIFGYVYGFGLNYIGTQQISVKPGIALDASGTVLISRRAITNFNVFISGTLNGSGNLDASPIGAAAQFASGFIVSGFWMFSGLLWPFRSGTGLMAISGTNVAGASGTDFLSQVAVGDLIGVQNSGYYRVSAVNSGVLTVISGSILSGSVVNIIENAFIGASGSTLAVPVNAINSDTTMTTGSGLWSGSCSGIIYIGGQPGMQVPLNVFVGQGNSGTCCFISTQRTNPLVSGMVGYV